MTVTGVPDTNLLFDVRSTASGLSVGITLCPRLRVSSGSHHVVCLEVSVGQGFRREQRGWCVSALRCRDPAGGSHPRLVLSHVCSGGRWWRGHVWPLGMEDTAPGEPRAKAERKPGCPFTQAGEPQGLASSQTPREWPGCLPSPPLTLCQEQAHEGHPVGIPSSLAPHAAAGPGTSPDLFPTLAPSHPRGTSGHMPQPQPTGGRHTSRTPGGNWAASHGSEASVLPVDKLTGTATPQTGDSKVTTQLPRLSHPPLINGEIGRLIVRRRREGRPVPANMGPDSLSAVPAQITKDRLTSPSPRAFGGAGALILMDLPQWR